MIEWTVDRLTDKFGDAVRPLLELDGTETIVVYQNQCLDSSRVGELSAMAVGPGRSYTLDEAIKGHLGDLPSQRMYPIAVVRLG